MKKYRSHKIVEAGKIVGVLSAGVVQYDVDDTLEDISNADHERMRGMAGGSVTGGYLVRYEDGYLSWSPAEAFEAGYSEI